MNVAGLSGPLFANRSKTADQRPVSYLRIACRPPGADSWTNFTQHRNSASFLLSQQQHR